MVETAAVRQQITFATLALAMLTATAGFSAPTAAQEKPARGGSSLTTLSVGRYQCSLPGDAGGPAWIPIEGRKFSIKNASRYFHPLGEGTYLLAGDSLVFTRGPMKDERYRRVGTNTLRALEPDGSLGRVRCVRTGPAQ